MGQLQLVQEDDGVVARSGGDAWPEEEALDLPHRDWGHGRVLLQHGPQQEACLQT